MKFELRRLPRSCPNGEIIAEIKRVDAIINKDVLTRQDFDKHGKMSSSRISQRFGEWEKALIAAGLDHKYGALPVFVKGRGAKLRKLSDDEVIAELKRIAQLLNKEYITVEDVRNHSRIVSDALIVRRFGSWSAGLKKAGLKISPLGRRYSQEDYFENLLNVWTHYGRQPYYREMDEPPSVITSGAYEWRFGSWRKALEAFVARMNKEEGDARESKKEVNEGVVTQKEHKPRENNQNNKNITKRIRILTEDQRGISLSLRYKVLNRDKFKCVKCGASPATNHNCKLHVDHIVPFSKAGKTVLDNLQTLCENCNLGKGDRLFA